MFHPDAELATAPAAAARGNRMFVSSVSSFSVNDIAAAGADKVGCQLYPTSNRNTTLGLLRRAERAGCRVVALTVDTQVLGNREGHATSLADMLDGGIRPGTDVVKALGLRGGAHAKILAWRPGLPPGLPPRRGGRPQRREGESWSLDWT